MTDPRMNAKNNDTTVSCKLTPSELQQRKASVIARLQARLLEKRELADGYSFRFPGTDEMVDQLAEFIKSERRCCSFFVFGLSFSGDGSESWLTITGPEGAREMITAEMGL